MQSACCICINGACVFKDSGFEFFVSPSLPMIPRCRHRSPGNKYDARCVHACHRPRQNTPPQERMQCLWSMLYIQRQHGKCIARVEKASEVLGTIPLCPQKQRRSSNGTRIIYSEKLRVQILHKVIILGSCKVPARSCFSTREQYLILFHRCCT